MATRITTIERRPRAFNKSVEEVKEYRRRLDLAEILTQISYCVFAGIEALLVIRLVLKLTGASPLNDLVAWIYNTTRLVVYPFHSVFPSPSNDGPTLELGTLLSMVGYLILFYLVVACFRFFIHKEQVIDT
jgi:hypothetical protein